MKAMFGAFILVVMIFVLGHGEPSLLEVLSDKLYQALEAWQPGG